VELLQVNGQKETQALRLVDSGAAVWDVEVTYFAPVFSVEVPLPSS